MDGRTQKASDLDKADDAAREMFSLFPDERSVATTVQNYYIGAVHDLTKDDSTTKHWRCWRDPKK